MDIIAVVDFYIESVATHFISKDNVLFDSLIVS